MNIFLKGLLSFLHTALKAPYIHFSRARTVQSWQKTEARKSWKRHQYSFYYGSGGGAGGGEVQNKETHCMAYRSLPLNLSLSVCVCVCAQVLTNDCLHRI